MHHSHVQLMYTLSPFESEGPPDLRMGPSKTNPPANRDQKLSKYGKNGPRTRLEPGKGFQRLKGRARWREIRIIRHRPLIMQTSWSHG